MKDFTPPHSSLPTFVACGNGTVLFGEMDESTEVSIDEARWWAQTVLDATADVMDAPPPTPAELAAMSKRLDDQAEAIELLSYRIEAVRHQNHWLPSEPVAVYISKAPSPVTHCDRCRCPDA